MSSKSFLNLIGLALVLAIIYIGFSFYVPNGRFHTLENVETILKQSCIIALVSLGMTYVIITAGIDLSVGSIAAFSSVVIAWGLMQKFAPWPSILLGVAAGALCGFVNGLLITRLKVGPFIVTLGTLLVVRAIGKGIAHEQKIDAPDTWITNILANLSSAERWKLLPVGVWFTFALAILMALILRYTRFGRHVVAVGSNEHAAKLCGVPADRVKVIVYCLSGLFAGLAGLMLFSRLTVGDPTVAQGLELDAIAAVVIGGASLTGGEGSIAGTMIGALITQTIRSGGSQSGWANWQQEIITGTIIVLAVALDRWRLRRAAAKTS